MIMHMRRVIKMIIILIKEIIKEKDVMKVLRILMKEYEEKGWEEINNPYRFM